MLLVNLIIITIGTDNNSTYRSRVDSTKMVDFRPIHCFKKKELKL